MPSRTLRPEVMSTEKDTGRNGSAPSTAPGYWPESECHRNPGGDVMPSEVSKTTARPVEFIPLAS